MNFDKQTLYNWSYENLAFHEGVPPGWTSAIKMFRELIPEAERYWLFEGKDAFERAWDVVWAQ